MTWSDGSTSSTGSSPAGHRLQRGDGDGGRRVAADRLQDDRRWLGADQPQLLGDHETVFLIGDHQRRVGAGQAVQPQPGHLQQGALAQQRQELLGMRLARQRPQPRAGAAGEDDWNHFAHGMTGRKRVDLYCHGHGLGFALNAPIPHTLPSIPTAEMPMPLPSRELARLNWTRAALDDPGAVLERASADASFRSYWRTQSGGQTWIVMDAPPDREDIRPWLDIARRLNEVGLHAPQIKAADADSGFVLMSRPRRQAVPARTARAQRRRRCTAMPWPRC